MSDIPATPERTFNVHDLVTLGTGKEVREVRDTRIHHKTNEMQYRVDLPAEANEKWVIASALHPFQVTAPLPGADPAQSISRMFEKLQADFVPPVAPSNVTTMFDESFVDALRKERDAARLHAAMLEKKVREQEAALLHPEPVYTRQPECWAVKTLNQKVGLPESDTAYAQCLNEGWQTENIAVVFGEGVLYRVITLKRLAPTSSSGSRPSATHAALTADYVREQQAHDESYFPRETVGAQHAAPFVQKRERMITEVLPVGTLIIANEPRKPTPIGDAIRTNGLDETLAQMDDHALSQVFARSAARRAAQPFFTPRPLRTFKAGV